MMRSKLRGLFNLLGVALVAFSTLQAPLARAQANGSPAILITNARVFDSRTGEVRTGLDVLIQGDKIAKVEGGISVPQDARVIDAGGRLLTPGFIDAHTHVMLQLSFGEAFSSDEFAYAYRSTQSARTFLSRGFTTIRDMSGNTFSLKKAIDQGVIDGPRIYPSGAMISQTAGHSDHRLDSSPSRAIAYEPTTILRYGMTAIADGRPEVLLAVRENLRRGASQIKIAVGGGYGSYADPLDVTQYSPDEIRTAVEAAEDWGTYVSAHVYNDRGAMRAINSGIKVIEHGNLLSRETLAAMQKQGVWLSPQVITYVGEVRGLTPDQQAKKREAEAGLDTMFKAAKSVNFANIAFGTDIITNPGQLADMNREFVLRQQWFTPGEILQQATWKSAQLLALSGRRNPYPAPLGVIAEGAYADLLLIDGEPLKDLSVLADPDRNIVLIMKGGKVWKNNLPSSGR